MTKISIKISRPFSSSRLYSIPGFISGLGSIFNLAGNYYDYNYSESGIEADNKAIQNDWAVVAGNFRYTIESLE